MPEPLARLPVQGRQVALGWVLPRLEGRGMTGLFNAAGYGCSLAKGWIPDRFRLPGQVGSTEPRSSCSPWVSGPAHGFPPSMR